MGNRRLKIVTPEDEFRASSERCHKNLRRGLMWDMFFDGMMCAVSLMGTGVALYSHIWVAGVAFVLAAGSFAYQGHGVIEILEEYGYYRRGDE